MPQPTLVLAALLVQNQQKRAFSKTAMEVINRRYEPVLRRRNLSKSEQQMMDEESGKIIPKIFVSDADSPMVNMYSPWTNAAALGALGGLAGGVVGSSVGSWEAGKPSGAGAGVGGTLGALIAGYIGHRLGKIRNSNIEELVRRLPPGASLRDAESDPVEQARMDREALIMSRMRD